MRRNKKYYSKNEKCDYNFINARDFYKTIKNLNQWDMLGIYMHYFVYYKNSNIGTCNHTFEEFIDFPLEFIHNSGEKWRNMPHEEYETLGVWLQKNKLFIDKYLNK